MPEPALETVALMMRDAPICALVRDVIYGDLHNEILEKNASAASLNGGAAADSVIAKNAASAATLAPSGDAGMAAPSARSASTRLSPRKGKRSPRSSNAGASGDAVA